MRRRAYLSAASVALLAGCMGDGGTSSTPTETPTSTETPTPTPTSTPTSTETATQRGADISAEDIEQARENATSPTYEDLFRNFENYEGEPVHFRFAAVNQALYEDEFTQLHLYVSNESRREADDDVMAWYYGDDRILEDDWLEIWALGWDLYKYETVQGDQRTIPGLIIAEYELLDEE